MRTIDQSEIPAERERAQARFRWLTTKTAGEIAGGVCDDTVRSWIADGKLRALDVGTEKRPDYRIKPEWLDAFMEAHTVNMDAA